MNVNTVVWLGIAVAIGLIVVVAGAWLFRQFRGRSTAASKSVWPVAFLISTFTLLSIGSKILELTSAVTLVDVAALSITGILSGAFLSFWLMSGRGQGE